jgi:hypothetical protein
MFLSEQQEVAYCTKYVRIRKFCQTTGTLKDFRRNKIVKLKSRSEYRYLKILNFHEKSFNILRKKCLASRQIQIAKNRRFFGRSACFRYSLQFLKNFSLQVSTVLVNIFFQHSASYLSQLFYFALIIRFCPHLFGQRRIFFNGANYTICVNCLDL